MKFNINNQMAATASEGSIQTATALHGNWTTPLLRGALVFVFLLLLTISAQCANWYVRPTAAGSNNGTAWNNAWSASSINWNSINGGDTLYIAGGTYGAFVVGKSGSSTAPINIRAAQDTYATTATFNGIVTCQQNYVTMDGGCNGQINFVVAPGNYIDLYGAIEPKVFYFDVSGATLGINATYGTGGEIGFCHIHNIIQDAGIRFTARNANNPKYDQTFVHDCDIQVNGNPSTGNGADGIQCPYYGLTFYNNHIYGGTGTLTGGEHMDLIQGQGTGYMKAYGNLFENTIDSMIGVDTMGSSSVSHFRIYNNVFRTTMAGYGTTAVRFYDSFSSPSKISSYTEMYVDNNTFIDCAKMSAPNKAISFNDVPAASCAVTDGHIRNNLIYNSGGASPAIVAGGCTASSGWDIDYNLMSPGAHGNASIYIASASATQAHPRAGVPAFVSYAECSVNNDFHLTGADTAARDKAASLTYFTTDKDNVQRPQGAAWDIGAFEYIGASAPSISVSPSTQAFGLLTLGASADRVFTVQNTGSGTLSGSATVPAPFSIVSGSPYSLAAGQSQTVTVRYSPTAVGTNSLNVTFSGANGATAQVTGSGQSSPTPAMTLTPSALSFGSIIAGATADLTLNVQNTGTGTLSGSATVSAPFSVISGSPYTLTAGQSQTLTIRYSPSAPGVNSDNVSCTGAGTMTVPVSGTAYASSALSFAATAGQITAPFVKAANYIYQPMETDVTTGGQATYDFVITNAGNYVFRALVNAPDGSANSLYFNIDAQPQDPIMIWDIPITSGFEQLIGGWRGTGTFDNDQYVPKIFKLTAGTHQLVIVAREANVQLQTVSIVPLPAAPKNIRIISP